MKTRTILEISADESYNLKVSCPDKNDAVMAIADQVHTACANGDSGPLNILFSATVHLLSMDVSGRLEEEYIENIRNITPKYRESYARMVEKMEKRSKNLS